MTRRPLGRTLTVESYLDTGDRANFANAGQVMRLYPDFSTGIGNVAAVWDALGCAPLVITGPALVATRGKLAERVGMIGGKKRRTVGRGRVTCGGGAG